MGGLSESSAGYDVAAMMSGKPGTTPTSPAVVTDANRCTGNKYECNALVARAKEADAKLDRERAAMKDQIERLETLEDVLQRGELGGAYSINMERIKRYQEIDVTQRNDIYFLEKRVYDLDKELHDIKKGVPESRYLAKLNEIEVILKQIPHGPTCKVDAGATCICHHKALRAILDAKN